MVADPILIRLSKRNVKQLVDIMHAVYEAGATHWTFGRYVPSVGITDDIIEPEEFREILIAVEENHKQYEKDYGRLTKEPLFFPLRNLQCPPDSKNNQGNCQIEGCGIGSLALTILPNDVFMACRRHLGSILGKWRQKGDLFEIFLHSSMIKTLRDIEKIERCGKCIFLYYCRGCRAVGYAVRGNLFDPDPSCPFFTPQKGGE